MATVALGIAASAAIPSGASALTAGLLTSLGGAIGGIIDNSLLFPAIFKKDPIRGPRVDSAEINTASEGEPIYECMGPDCRLPGTLIWAGPLIEEEVTTNAGGKGGGGQDFIGYHYYRDIAVAWVKNPANRVPRLFMNGELVYDEDGDISIESNQISATLDQTILSGGPPSVFTIQDSFLDLESPNGGPDLSQLKPGVNLTISGWAHGGNNGSWMVVSSSKNETTGVSKCRIQEPLTPSSTPVFASEAAGNTVTITQDLPTFLPGLATSITHYLGTDTQNPDPVIESIKGVGNVPAWRGLTYTVVKKLALDRFGNRIPTLFHAVIEEAENRTVDEAIESILLRAGYTEDQYDVSGIAGIELLGYNIRGPQASGERLLPLMIAHNITAREENGQLVFFTRENAPVVSIPSEHLAAHEFGDTHPPAVQLDDSNETLVPQQVNVGYIDPKKDLQPGSQVYRRNRGKVADSVISLDLPIVMSSSKAQCIARRVGATVEANHRSVTLTLPAWYFSLRENDVVTFSTEGHSYRMITTEITRGNNWLIQVSGVIEQSQTLTFADCPTDDPGTLIPVIDVPPSMTLHILDVAPLRSSDTDVPGYYIGAAITDPNLGWSSAQLYQSDDNSTFTHLRNAIGEVAMGLTSTVLSEGLVGTLDVKNSVEVTMIHGELASTDMLELLNGANRAIIGNEIIGFLNAELVGTNRYRLSGLIRGLRDTWPYATTSGSHTINERFVLLNQVGLTFEQLNMLTLGAVKYYKAVPRNGDPSSYLASSHTHRWNNMKPFSPTHIRGSRDIAGNLTIAWVRRTRAIHEGLNGTLTPILDLPEQYQVDIIAPGGGSVVRTLNSGPPTTLYTATAQTADGYTPGSLVRVKVYQISQVVGRGNPSEEVQV